MNKQTDFMFSENSPDTTSQPYTRLLDFLFYLLFQKQKRYKVTFNKKNLSNVSNKGRNVVIVCGFQKKKYTAQT